MILIVSRIQMRSADTKAVVKGVTALLCDRRIDFAVCAIMAPRATLPRQLPCPRAARVGCPSWRRNGP